MTCPRRTRRPRRTNLSHSKGGGKSDLLAGLKNRSASAEDSSMKLGKESVNSDATRSETAKEQPTIGPRCA